MTFVPSKRIYIEPAPS